MGALTLAAEVFLDVAVVVAGYEAGGEDLGFHVLDGEYPVVDGGHRFGGFDAAEYGGYAGFLVVARGAHFLLEDGARLNLGEVCGDIGGELEAGGEQQRQGQKGQDG